MSYTVAQNLGHRKLTLLYSALKRGADLKECAELLGLSPSRTSRIINALFEFVPAPKPWTVDYLEHQAGILRSQADEVESDRKQMSGPIFRLVRDRA